MKTVATALLCGVFAAHVLANPNPAPEPREIGTPIPMKEIPDFQIEMLSENVTLTLMRAPIDPKGGRGQPYEGASARLAVSGDYRFKNYGDAQTLDICFPCRDKLEAETVKVSLDGKEGKARPMGEDDEVGTPWGGWMYESWMTWKADFPAKAECTMHVEYTVVMRELYEAGYIVKSGAPWKGKIGKANFTLKFAEGFKADFVRKLSPADSVKFKDDVYTWEFKDFEPDNSHNISIGYALESWKDKVARMRERATNWQKKYVLAERLARPPLTGKLADADAEKREDFLAALEALVPRSKEAGEKLIIYSDLPVRMPTRDPEDYEDRRNDDYDYDDSFVDSYFEIVELATRALRELPTEKRARAVLQSLVKILRACHNDKLYLDGDEQDNQVHENCDELVLQEAEVALHDTEGK